jgi:hypothetical protein
MKNKSRSQLLKPLGAYAFVIFAITLMRSFLPSGIVIPLAAVLMFGVPFLMKSNVSGLKWNTSGVLLGIGASVVILSLFVLIIDKPVRLGRVFL